jgi:hypothetical protein
VRKPGHTLRLVTAALQGRLPPEAEWPAVLEVANQGWLAPALYVALERAGQSQQIPPPVRDYLSFIHERNCERNRRLRVQLLEAVIALDADAIEPILLKGAVHLFTAAEGELGTRMISDLDISIAPAELAGAKSALFARGYRSLANDRELAREDDVGVIELHDRPSARSAPYLSTDLRACSTRMTCEGAVARIPTATARALHLIVHDMIKERDYWSFRIDLRHLNDLAELARSAEGIDWQQLCHLLPQGTGRKALIVEARALEDLYAVPIPAELRPGRRAELRHMARLACASRGPLPSAARVIGNLSRGVHEMREGFAWRGGWQFSKRVYRRLAARSTGSRV